MKNFDSHTYQTGRTQPPKSRQGLMAVLLILVILLAGAVSALSLMNIHLFRMLEEKNERFVCFSEKSATAAVMSMDVSDGVEAPLLGLKGQEFTSLYRSYQQWPQGIYISWVSPNGPAAKAQVGDILIAMGETPISDRASFEKAVSEIVPGEKTTLTVFRDDKEVILPVVLPKS